jgi:hypothetical protein
VDVYVTGASDPLTTAVALQSAVAVDSVGSFITVNSGTWRLRITAAGNKDDLRLDISGLTLGSKQVATLVITPAAGGVMAQALLLTQQGGIGNLAATLARVRVASGLTATSVRLGEAEILPAFNEATVTSYSTTAAGNQTLVVTVGGATLASTVKALTAGADYTLLVHGTAAAPLVSWVDDDNTRPSDTAKAKVRLVNGVSGLSGNLSMSVNSTPAAVDVAAGTGSTYKLQTVSSTATIGVAGTSGGSVFSAVDQTFAAASSYTVFVLGPSSGATGILRQDR